MDSTSIPSMSMHISPLLPMEWLIGLAVCGMVLAALGSQRQKHASLVRVFCMAAFLVALLNPSILKEQRVPARDVAVIVVDQSGSQDFGKRKERTQRALTAVKAQLEKEPNLDVQVVEAPDNSTLSRDTRLFNALDLALSNVPQKRRAGVIFITDGQIHDVPDDISGDKYGPVSALLSGEHGEKDRQIVITNAPAYGLVDKNVTIKFKVEDTDNIHQDQVHVTLSLHSGKKQELFVRPGVENSVTVPIEHPSQNVFTLEADPVEGELTKANNKVPVIINGVRNRLKVLLVSGLPHAGARTWRDLLTSDPGVDLVHFTILREPDKIDYTPQRELSLIAFPFDELFNVKLYDFDLIVFDQYRVNNILPARYFRNIAKYVENGGAFLEASGPDFADDRHSLYNTPLREILPARPSGKVIKAPFKPELTELGRKHPVTRSLVWSGGPDTDPKDLQNWGDWMRYIDIDVQRGDVLMKAMDDRPLLVLSRVGKGRVAQLASDHVWLWARGYQGGGPHAELLRRTMHWLMKEPELDERALNVQVNKDTILIRKPFIDRESESVAMSDPNGNHSIIELKKDDQDWLSATVHAPSLGVYAFEDTNGTRKFAIVGDLNPPELRGVVTTAEKIKPVLEASKGGAIWLDKVPEPRVRFLGHARAYAGSNWVGLRRNNNYTVTDVKDIPLLPKWALLLGLLSITIFMWWFEGRKRS